MVFTTSYRQFRKKEIMEKEWNPNDYQGRSQKQVENNNKVFGMMVILVGFTIIGILVYKFINLLF